jgi:hypothetical protein
VVGVRRWARSSGGDKDGPVSWGRHRGVSYLTRVLPRAGRGNTGIWLGVCFLKDGVVTASGSGFS